MRFSCTGLPGQPSHDQTKPGALASKRRSRPNTRRARGEHGGPGQGRPRQFPDHLLPAAGMPHMMMAFIPMEFVVTPETTYSWSACTTIFAASSPTDATGPDIEPTFAGYSIGRGSTRTATAATTCSRSRRAASKGRALTTSPACPCTSTTSRSSRSASISTRPTRTSCTTR